jgi:hypothetical protein
MLWIHLLQDMTANLANIDSWSEIGQLLHLQAFPDAHLMLLETDVFADFRAWLTNFIDSGQVWALVIGFVIGFLLRSFTSYG